MAWEGVVTDAGVNALQQFIAGEANINFNLVKLGSGSVDVEDMKEQTDIQDFVTNGSIQKVTYSEEGARFRLSAGSYGDAGYTWTELGLFASVTVGNVTSSVMMALYQETNGGVIIPNAEAFPDFVYVLSVLIKVDNSEELEVTIDPDAYVAHSVYQEDMTAVRQAIAAMVNTIYPIGSIYTSVNNVDPGLLFQNTAWERIQDVFLMAAGVIHAAGEQGGKETYAAADMPKHTHGAGSYYPSASGNFILTGPTALHSSEGIVSGSSPYSSVIGGDTAGWGAQRININLNNGNSSVRGTSGSSGTNDNATILPPYLAVYMWKRVA